MSFDRSVEEIDTWEEFNYIIPGLNLRNSLNTVIRCLISPTLTDSWLVSRGD